MEGCAYIWPPWPWVPQRLAVRLTTSSLFNYEQIGACNGFNDGQTATTAGANAAHLVFRVSSVDNKDTNARDFEFDPNRLFVNLQVPRAYTRTTLRLAQLNPFYATARHVRGLDGLA